MQTSGAVMTVAGEREHSCVCPLCGRTVQRGDFVAVCRACGAVHHAPCWEKGGGCGSYACAPVRRELPADMAAALRITSDDLGRAVPLPTRRPPPSFPPAAPRVARPRTNQLAWAALAVGIAGIPLFGVVTGLVAILLGALALGAIHHTKQRGTGLAVAGLLLGLFDVVAWVIFLSVMLFRPSPTFRAELQLDEAALQDLAPIPRRAMQSNAYVEAPGGLLGGHRVGSGVILRRDGGDALLVTNRHVVDPNYSGAGQNDQAPERLAEVQVQLLGQGPRPAKVVWLAPHGADLALVRVPCNSDQARAARWRPGRPLQVGQQVFAIGNPHGLGWTQTQGIISQLRRQRLEGFDLRVIQTQTPLNPGNSGGGLFDAEGYLVGINTWIHDPREGGGGLGFAITFDSLLALHPDGLGEPDEREEKK
jgi:hypothetical protein